MCMMVTLSGLTRGSLEEFGDRWEQMDADLMITPRVVDVMYHFSSRVSDKYAARLRQAHPGLIERAIPAMLHPMKVGPREYLAAGVDVADFEALTGGRTVRRGRLCDPDGRFATWLEEKLLTGGGDSPVEISTEELSQPGRSGLEIVVDSRLARSNDLEVGQTLTSANHEWKIVGIVPAGGVARIYLPRRAAQFLFGNADITKSSMIFVKLRPGASAQRSVEAIRSDTGYNATSLAEYRSALRERFNIMLTYMDMVNGIALVVAFLFIMITLYTMVLQRTREIAILKSHGASNWFVLRQILAESVILTAAGTLVGILLSFPAGEIIESSRLTLTVTVTWKWIGIALIVASVGAVASALYPGWRATRVDVVEALRLE
jgi:hypothetical protein